MGRVTQFNTQNPLQQYDHTPIDAWEDYKLLTYQQVKDGYPSFCVVALFFHAAKTEQERGFWSVYCVSGTDKFHFNYNNTARRYKMLSDWRKEIIESPGTLIHGLCLGDSSFINQKTQERITYTDLQDSTVTLCSHGERND